MKRRDLFKMMGTLAAVPFVAPLLPKIVAMERATAKPEVQSSRAADKVRINLSMKLEHLPWELREHITKEIGLVENA